MIKIGLQRQMQWLTVSIVTVVVMLFLTPAVDASCGDYLHRRSISLPEDAHFVLYSGFQPDGSLTRNQLQAVEFVSSVAQFSAAVSAGTGAANDASGSDELLRRTECRGPHCQKSPTGGSNPVQLISVARDHQDLLDTRFVRDQQFNPSHVVLYRNDSHETSRGYPLLPEIPPEPMFL